MLNNQSAVFADKRMIFAVLVPIPGCADMLKLPVRVQADPLAALLEKFDSFDKRIASAHLRTRFIVGIKVVVSADGPAKEPDHVESERIRIVRKLSEISIGPENLLVLLFEYDEKPAVHLFRPGGESSRFVNRVIPGAILPRRYMPVALVADV